MLIDFDYGQAYCYYYLAVLDDSRDTTGPTHSDFTVDFGFIADSS